MAINHIISVYSLIFSKGKGQGDISAIFAAHAVPSHL
jgi:hypothetical protein